MNKYSTVRMKSDRPRAERDFYPTPKPLVNSAIEKLMRDEEIEAWESSSWNILDPGCGDGVWSERLDYYFMYPDDDGNIYPFKIGIDIQQTKAPGIFDIFILKDYLSSDYLDKKSFDLVIGNPPFSLAEEFVHKSFELLNNGGYIYFLLRLAFLEGRKRQLSLFEKLPLKRISVLTRRPSFFSTKKKSKTTDTLAYAMLLWQKGYEGKPELDWLYWENEE